MRIKGMDDALKLVDELPEKYQKRVLEMITMQLDDYEERIQHPEMSDLQYVCMKMERVGKLIGRW